MTMPDQPITPRDGSADEGAAFTGRLAEGDPAAFELLFTRYFNRLRRYAYGYTRAWAEAEDVVHDVFLRLWRRRRWLGQVRDLNAYVYRITRNLALNHLRRRAVEDRWRAEVTAQQSALAAEQVAHTPAAEQAVASAERVGAILRALDALPPRQREIVLLRWREGKSREEIAARLGISLNTIEIHITRAYKRLRQVLAHL